MRILPKSIADPLWDSKVNLRRQLGCGGTVESLSWRECLARSTSLKEVPWCWLFPVTQLSGLCEVKSFLPTGPSSRCVCLAPKVKGREAKRPQIETLGQGKPFFTLLFSNICHNNSLPGWAQTELTLVNRGPQGGLGQFLCRKKPVWTGQKASLQVKGSSDVWLRISGAFWTLSKSLKGNLC